MIGSFCFQGDDLVQLHVTLDRVLLGIGPWHSLEVHPEGKSEAVREDWDAACPLNV